MPDGYWICPHTHPIEAHLRVISGTFLVGMGSGLDTGTARALALGGEIALLASMAHYEGTRGTTVIEIRGEGPWGIAFVDPRYDPSAVGGLRCTPRAGSSRADTLPPAAAIETSYTIKSGALGLGGTLTVPRGVAGRVPVAVIIAGSGPTDRNGNSVMGIRPNSYAQLAWRLAERGIATLRYDKRGMPGTQGTFDITRMTLEDFAADARAAAESLARDSRFSRVVLVGHSEGASLALIAARQGAPVAGVIHVSGLGRGLGEVLREQLSRQFDSATIVRYDTAMKYYLRGEQPADVPPQLAMLFLPMNQTFLRSLAAFDPPAAIRAVRPPVLIVQGETDLQATVADAERLHAARPDARLVVIPEVNHVLKHVADRTLAGQMGTYQDPTIPIVRDAVAAIADWIRTLGDGP
jgi:pimeloyl-ACP methyl ester carboxylesterase